MTLLTWPKTSSTGSSESTWAKGKDTEDVNKKNRNVFHSMNGSFLRPCGRHTHLSDNAAALVEGDDGLGGFVIQIQPLLDGLLVVVRAPAGLAALHEPLDHGLCSSVDVQQQAGFADLQRQMARHGLKVTPQPAARCGASSLTFFSNSSPCFTSRG